MNLSFEPKEDKALRSNALPENLKPIPLFVNLKHKDLILVPETCPAFKLHQERIKASPEYKEIEKNLKDNYFPKIPAFLGVTDLKQFHQIRDVLDCRVYNGRTIGNMSD